MNIQNFKSLWSNPEFKKSYDNIHKAIMSEHTVKLLFPGCNLEYNEKSRHVGYLGLNGIVAQIENKTNKPQV